MARKLAQRHLDALNELANQLEQVHGTMDTVWFGIDSSHPADQQLYIALAHLEVIQRTVSNIIVTCTGR